MIIKVTKYREFPPVYDEYSIDSDRLGEMWVSFFLKTNFCRVLSFKKVVNSGPRLGYNGFVYTVEGNNRAMVYDSNLGTQEARFMYVRQFVDAVLQVYKHGERGW
jgi:hypothetical protein